MFTTKLVEATSGSVTTGRHPPGPDRYTKQTSENKTLPRINSFVIRVIQPRHSASTKQASLAFDESRNLQQAGSSKNQQQEFKHSTPGRILPKKIKKGSLQGPPSRQFPFPEQVSEETAVLASSRITVRVVLVRTAEQNPTALSPPLSWDSWDCPPTCSTHSSFSSSSSFSALKVSLTPRSFPQSRSSSSSNTFTYSPYILTLHQS
ncbi:uncharacterized protein H6S33_012849 [Morchella sextelata]|uniref:uncharacterized protein n=1 Tax=Morchella sextelata TaxID=1174677 RepID=UPI001D037AE9|nr:uncharacterized protein H6S33_012849 [Morchella sextelata]KAH0609363.1 hypothetical protein H6S33_012849 [Morchella sextelata]